MAMELTEAALRKAATWARNAEHLDGRSVRDVFLDAADLCKHESEDKPERSPLITAEALMERLNGSE